MKPEATAAGKRALELVAGDYPAGLDPGSPRRELIEYLEVPLRHPFRVLIPFVLITAAAWGASYLAPELYLSSTTILVESERVPSTVVPRMATDTAASRLQTLKQEILSRTRLEMVAREIDPYPGWQPLSAAIEHMRSQIDIKVKGNDAFTIEFIHRNPRTAMRVANRLASLFIEEATGERERQVKEANEFIESRLEEARRAIEGNEAAVSRYKQTHMGTLPEQMGANLATLQRLQLEQQALTAGLQAARERQNAAEKGLAEQLQGTSPAGTVVLDALGEAQQLRRELARLRSRYTDEHPDVRQILVRLERLDKDLASQGTTGSAGTTSPTGLVRAQLEQARREVAALEDKLKDVERRIAAMQARVDQTPRVELELATMTRDFRMLNDNYLALLSKKLGADMAEKLEERWKGEQFRILDPAHLPDRPFAPDRPRYVIVGLILGLLVGLGAAIATETVDHSVKSVAELEAILPFPVLAMFPHVKARATGAPPARSKARTASGRGR